ncbi:NUDIX domain-containing protein [Burkholderia multivorans]|uniref:NUDIX hydrolase n=1 Tax=Burkholderia multivorans (strain ATCC 17616 / 249) TaxID=395019 RepID=A0A0H3KLZ2_BURM1|nr:NUDIX domain-containing protein [Burkholderia multivorans]MEB2485977.1 NUDIX domain-containing protein [Burkholderia multivorans]MEB2568675.1 NUDIX domain-containing protein [Burkholderia multivorans]PRF51222.1 NUDIX domain-containing protein [Burkholderia multivorans]BAG46260.1 NUDIX hydrolase [Burkholderia multivorans ATCC 17616]
MNKKSDLNIRVSAKAIVIHQDHLLLIRYKSDSDEWYTLPGGGQLFGERLSETLVRECLEETTFRIEPSKLVFVREYIGANHEFAEFDGDTHQIELMFLASLAGEGTNLDDLEINADRDQVGAQWLKLEDVANAPLFPAALRSLIAEKQFTASTSIYLGDVN